MYVVTYDPKGMYWEGGIVDEGRGRKLLTRGVSLLPVNPALFGQHPGAGYARRGWGAGYPLNPIPGFVAPLVLYVLPSLHELHWQARLIADKSYIRQGEEEPEKQLKGNIRIAEFGQGGVSLSGEEKLRHYDLSKLGEPDAEGCWVVEGKANLNVSGKQFCSLALYGEGEGIRVLWLAVTQTAKG